MSLFVSKMAEEFFGEWHEQGDNLKENLTKLLQVGDDCINLWLSPAENNHKYNCLTFENRLMEYLEAIDENLLNMQKCIMNVLRYLSHTRKQLSERLAYKDKHSRCQSQILELQGQNSALKENIENYERKSQTILEKSKEQKNSQYHFIKDKEDILYWYKEQEIQNLNREIGKTNLENQYLKQRIVSITEKYNMEIRSLQKCLKNNQDKFSEHAVSKEKDAPDATLVNEFATNHIEILERSFEYFVNDYKRLNTENQQLHLKLSGSVLEEGSNKLSQDDSDIENCSK